MVGDEQRTAIGRNEATRRRESEASQAQPKMKVHPKAQEVMDEFGYLWDDPHSHMCFTSCPE
jgi:hypothetical protein